MTIFRATAAIVAMSLPLPAIAQTAADAFECKLPYRASIEAASKLKVIKQSKPFDWGLFIATTVDLEPGATKVFGLTPVRTNLTMREPGKSATNKAVTMSLYTTVARTPAVEAALGAAVKWEYACSDSIPQCRRSFNPPGNGKLSMSYSKAEITLQCEFEVREEDLK